MSVYDDKTEASFEETIDEYTTRFYQDSDREIVRIKHNIWSIGEETYLFNIIITSLLCIFDAVLLDSLPTDRERFFEDLLRMNSHQVRSSKLCLAKEHVHLRIIRGLEDFDYSEFNDHVLEYRELYPVIKETLLDRYFSEEA